MENWNKWIHQIKPNLNITRKWVCSKSKHIDQIQHKYSAKMNENEKPLMGLNFSTH